MASMKVTRAVTVRAIVTEQLKQELTDELQGMADETQRRIDQMDFEARRYLADLQRTNLSQAMAVRDQIDTEKKKQERVREELLARIEEVKKLPQGAEFLRGTLEGLVEVKPGDNLSAALAGAALVVRDDVVVEIREDVEQPKPPEG